MDLKLTTYLAYLLISILLTIWVARTLFKNGQVFLDDAFADERLAESVNHLLVVGFYLLNLGFVAIALKVTGPVAGGSGAMETLAAKLGLVLLVLGGVHFANLFVLSRFRRRRLLEQAAPPIEPTRTLAPPRPGPETPRPPANRRPGPEEIPPPR
ncbi:hypothetical protein ACPPVO_46150 [Dactylosporangium sp. McL0621]|uniref:hypothetical protein n=1 Tax=Dactylosporangium sp. McL0621 TaxID=3415678 RepID=UPI003CF947F6